MRLKSYDYSIFMATPLVSTNTSTNREISDNLVRTEALDQLKIEEKLKVIIAQGFDPENATRWQSRSDALFYVVCELVREGQSDEVILGIITDSRYMISQSVLDKGSQMMRYAKRQISQARDKAEHTMLHRMNQEFTVVKSYGGKVAVLVKDGQIDHHSGRSEFVIQNMRELRDRIKNYPKIEFQVENKIKQISAFEWWTSHRRRSECLGVAFEPGLELDGYVNLWSGFSVMPVPGDRHQRFLEHVWDVICDRDDDNFEYVKSWMARAVQTPRTCSMVALVLLGTRGTGKSVFCDFFGQIFDPHRHVVSGPEALTGQFNAHLAQCLLAVAEEAFDLRDRRHESVLKELITGRSISVRRMYFDRVQMPNYAKIIMTSNNEKVVPAGDYERRFMVTRVSDRRRGDREYFGKLMEDQRSGGVANLLHYLSSVDLSKFDVTHVPQTKALRLQQEYSLSLELEWLLHKLETGQWFEGKPHNWDKVLKRELHADYLQYMEQAKARHVRGVRAFHQFIVRELPETRDKQVYERAGATDRVQAFVFPSLERCRELYAERRGWTDHEWPSTTGEAEVLEIRPLKRPEPTGRIM